MNDFKEEIEGIETVKQDKRLLDVKIAEAFKDKQFRKYTREKTSFIKKSSCPKNKTKNIELKFVQTTFDDLLQFSVDELIGTMLQKLIDGVSEHFIENKIDHSFEITKAFLKKTDYKIDLSEFQKIKIKDFVFYYSIERCKKEMLHYEFKDVNLNRDISEAELEDVKKNAVFSEEMTTKFDIRFIFPVKKGKK